MGFKRTLALHPNAAAACVGLGAVEFSQQRFESALAQFQNVTRVAPQAGVGWIGSSVSAERLGRKADCLRFARRATEVAPKSFGAWNNLARQESLYGSKQTAGAALQRANQLAAAARKR